MEEAAAAMLVLKRRRPAGDDDQHVPPGDDKGSGEEQGSLDDLDFISRLPDAVLGTVVSLLPTKDGARTQALSRRWLPLWRSPMAPLSLVADLHFFDDHTRAPVVSKVLSDHSGPARRFTLHLEFLPDLLAEVDGWFRSESLTGLQELEVTNVLRKNHYLLPQHALARFATTLSVLRLGGCACPNMALPSFPHLKQLIMYNVSVSEDSLQSMISGCLVLQSVSLHNMGFRRLCISSPTLRSIGFYPPRGAAGVTTFQELVIEDAPCLERLLPIYPDDGPATIRVIRALCHCEKLYVTVSNPGPATIRLHGGYLGRHDMDNVSKYDPLHPVECLELHLKKVVLKNFTCRKNISDDKKPFIDYANFFVLNAKVLKKMEIRSRRSCSSLTQCQCSQLQVENRACRDAQIEVKIDTDAKRINHGHTHDLSVTDPFE